MADAGLICMILRNAFRSEDSATTFPKPDRPKLIFNFFLQSISYTDNTKSRAQFAIFHHTTTATQANRRG